MTFTLNEPTAEEAASALVERRSALAALQKGSRLEGIGSKENWNGLRVAIYARISRAEEGKTVGVDRQVAICEERVRQRGGELVGIYRDNDVSASRFSTKPRPGFEAMMTSVMAGDADLILVYDSSRLYRRRTEFAALLDLFERESARFAVAVVFGNIDLTTAHGRFQATMDNGMNIMESERISYRVRTKNAEVADAAKPRGSGRRAFGWEADGVTPRADEVKLLRDAWDRILDGASINSIAKQWEEAGVRSTRGNLVPWSKSRRSLKLILTNPRHVGDLVYNGEVHRSGAWDGIIDRDEFALVLAAIERISFTRQRVGPRRRVPYTGLLVCGRCDDQPVMDRSARSRKYGGDKTYRCPRCSLTILAEPTERIIREAAFDWVESDEFRKAVKAEAENPEAMAEVQAEIAAIRQRIDETDDMWNAIPPQMTRSSYVRNMATLEDRLEQAKERLRKLVEAKRSGTTTLRNDWPSLTVEVQRQMLHTVLDRVIIDPARPGSGFNPRRIRVRVARWGAR